MYCLMEIQLSVNPKNYCEGRIHLYDFNCTGYVGHNPFLGQTTKDNYDTERHHMLCSLAQRRTPFPRT